MSLLLKFLPSFLKTPKKGLLYRYEDLTPSYYEQIRSDRETEHQIGRFMSFKHIISECAKLKGHFIEFGTLSGFSLMWIAHLAEKAGMFSKKIVGLDGFVGLPYADGTFKKGDFTASFNECLSNLSINADFYPRNYQNLQVKKVLFSQKKEAIELLMPFQSEKFCFIHVDCDVSQSAIEVFEILITGNYIADKAFIVFDDFYCDSSLRNTVPEIFKSLTSQWDIQHYSRTNLTQTFMFTKKNEIT